MQRTSTEAQLDCPWIPEARLVRSRQGVGRGRRGGRVRGRRRGRTVGLSASMPSGQPTTGMEEGVNSANV